MSSVDPGYDADANVDAGTVLDEGPDRDARGRTGTGTTEAGDGTLGIVLVSVIEAMECTSIDGSSLIRDG